MDDRKGRKLSVLCVDDSADVAEMLGATINGENDMECAGCLYKADRLLFEAERLDPDVLIVDLTMPGKDPLEAVSEIAASPLKARVIVHSGYDDDETIETVFDAGAWGFVSKQADTPQMLEAIRKVARGERHFPRHLSGSRTRG